MAELGAERPGVWADRTEAREGARERFLTPAMGVGLGVFVLFALAFDSGKVDDDGFYYFNFVRDVFGEDLTAQAYQFGSAFWTTPFYLVSRFVAFRGDLDAYHSAEIATTVAANVATILVLYLGWRMLRELDLPRGPGILLLTLFGTPLYFYAVMRPSYKHAADTLYTTAAFFFLLLATRQPRRRYLVAAGACLGLMFATRYANLVVPAGVVVMFAGLRAWRPLAWVLGVAAATGVLLFALPVVRGIPFSPQPTPWFTPAPSAAPAAPAPVTRLAIGDGFGHVIDVPGSSSSSLSPTAPEKMLFTLHRGLFIWTPLTAFAAVGFVLLAWRDRRHRWFLIGLGVSAFALLQVHMIWGAFWDGGGSFSSRFLTSLFPLYLLGAAEFVRRTRHPGYVVLSLCVAWSLWLGLVQMVGYANQSGKDGVVEIVREHDGSVSNPHGSLGAFGHRLRLFETRRWDTYRDLVS